MITKTHHFFLLPLSPWPLLSSVSRFNLLFSFLIFVKFQRSLIFFLSLLNSSFSCFFWWIYYGKELNIIGTNSFILEKGLKLSMILFIRSEILFFFSFFWSYFHFFLSPTMETGLLWPPIRVEIFNFINVPLINTLVLMRSGLTVTIRHFFLIEGNKKFFNLFLSFTILLGGIFSILQAIEYKSSFFSIRDSTFGTAFFILTGFHGIHVLIGTIFLTVSMIRSLELNSSNCRSLNFEMSSWYWHFVDVVWIFLYFMIYYLNN